MRIALLCLVLLWTGNATAAARIAVVAGNASGHYARLVEKSLDGDTLFFKSGEYEVSHLYITKRLTLLGEDGTVFNGKGQPILFVATDSVVVAGIVFKNVHTSYVADHAAPGLLSAVAVGLTIADFKTLFSGFISKKQAVRALRATGFRVCRLPRPPRAMPSTFGIAPIILFQIITSKALGMESILNLPVLRRYCAMLVTATCAMVFILCSRMIIPT